ncbi:MAG: TIM barrel protein [archaeon]
MIFNTAYTSPLDHPDYAPTAPMGIADQEMPTIVPESSTTFREDLGVRDIGMSVPMGIAAGNVDGVSAKIRSGVGKLEIGFPGAMSGQRQAQTPEMYGIEQRRALRELAKANEIEFTTHASYGVMGLMGSDQQGNVALTRARQGVSEVERAIDFAADVAGGGSVVVHTGEFERPLTHIFPDGRIMNDDGNLNRNWSRENGTDRLMFKKRLTEEADAVFQLVDDRTGQGYQTVQLDRLAAQPVWLRARESFWGENQEGKKVYVRKGDYIDYENRRIDDPYNIAFEKDATKPYKPGRVPEYDLKTGRFKTKLTAHDDFEREAREYNQYYETVMGEKPNYYNRATGREQFMKSTLQTQASHSRGWAGYYGERIDRDLDIIKKLKEKREEYRKLDESLPESEKWKMLRQDPEFAQHTGGLLDSETKHPLEMIDDQIKQVKKRLEFSQEASAAQEMQAEDTTETMRHLITADKYMESHAINNYAILGVKAYQRSKDPKNPLVLTLENIFPDRYGGHPQELKHMVKMAREHMADFLSNPNYKYGDKGGWFKKEGDKIWDYDVYKPGPNPYYVHNMSKERAKEVAAKHIKITLDTGHLNMWRKFWQEKQGLSQGENDREFDRWMLSQVEDLAKNGLIGNVHLTDNYGHQDDHLAPGQGNVPIKPILNILKKYGYAKAITVEPGADASTDQSDVHGLMKTWRHLGAPVYGMVAPSVHGPDRSWTNIQHSYFGRNYAPYFVFGAYSPSNDWTLWSGVPME